MSEQNKMVQVEPIPCPFCGEGLVLKFDHHGSWWAHEDEPGKCHASTDQLFDEQDILAWNLRAAPPIEPTEADRLAREIADATSRWKAEEAARYGNGWFEFSAYADLKWPNYLKLRGLLEHHPTDPNLVRVKQERSDG